MGTHIISVLCEYSDLLKSVWDLVRPPRHALSNLSHLIATLIQDTFVFVQRALSSCICHAVDYTPGCLVTHGESFVKFGHGIIAAY